VLGDHRPGQDSAGVAHQALEDGELPVGQRNLALALPDPPRRRIEADVPGRQDRVQRVRRAAGEGAQPRQ
jgi:hypothetical protein